MPVGPVGARGGLRAFHQLLDEHEQLRERIASPASLDVDARPVKARVFYGDKGAAHEQHGRNQFPGQTTDLGTDIIRHTKKLLSHAVGADPKNITFYLASGTGTGESLIWLNGRYNRYMPKERRGTFHVLVNGSFGDRIRRQAAQAGARLKTFFVPYGSTPTPEDIEKHFGAHASNGDTIALTHLETSTTVENNVRLLVPLISKIYEKKGLKKPMFVIDATSSSGIRIKDWDKQGYKVSVYMGTVKPITAKALAGIVYSTHAAEEEMENRRRTVLETTRRGEATIPRYLDHMLERQAQAANVRARYTQPVKIWWRIAENLMWFFSLGGNYQPHKKMEDLVAYAHNAMNERRRILQDYYASTLGLLGFDRYGPQNAHSLMLMGMVKPDWLKDPQDLLQESPVDFQVGYAGEKPGLWRRNVDPRIQAHTHIFRINTYYPRDMGNELKKANAIVSAAFNLAVKNGVIQPAQREEVKRHLDDIKLEAEHRWIRLQEQAAFAKKAMEEKGLLPARGG